MNDVRMTVLVENTAGRLGLLAEHGLSFWIELGSQKVLFDTGQGQVLSGNAHRLAVRLELVDAVILSHGHYDHTGGLGYVLRSGRRPRVYGHPAVFEPKYAGSADGSGRDIGIPLLSEGDVRKQAELIWTEAPTEVGEGLMLTGPVPRRTDFEDTGGAFFTDKDCAQPDDLVDDQAAFLETSAGTIVILGCAHAGVINTLRHVRTLTEDRPIHAVVGGMHLVRASAERLSRTIEEFRRLGVERLGPAHCTGAAAVVALWNAFPGQVLACHVGSRFEFESPVPTIASAKSGASAQRGASAETGNESTREIN